MDTDKPTFRDEITGCMEGRRVSEGFGMPTISEFDAEEIADGVIAVIERRMTAIADTWHARTSEGQGSMREHWRGADYVDGNDAGIEQCVEEMRAMIVEIKKDTTS